MCDGGSWASGPGLGLDCGARSSNLNWGSLNRYHHHGRFFPRWARMDNVPRVTSAPHNSQRQHTVLLNKSLTGQAQHTYLYTPTALLSHCPTLTIH